MRGYLDLARQPGLLNITAAQLFARLPQGMLSLAILIHVHALTGSYGVAGAVVACVSVGESVVVPFTSRLTGILGVAPTLIAAAVTNCVAMVFLAFAPPNSALMVILGLLIGVSVPPVASVVRAVYPQLVPDTVLPTLFAVDATAQELIWIIGPVAATLLASALWTALPLIATASITITGTVWFLTSPRLRGTHIPRTEAGFGRVLAGQAMILAMAASFALVASFTALEVAIIAQHNHNGVLAGILLALSGFGSLVGGVLLGHRRLGVAGLVAILAVVTVGTALSGVVVGPVLQSVALFFAGVGFAPALSTFYLTVSSEVAKHAAAEAFGWLTTAALVGAAAGTGLAGVASDAYGPAGAFVAATLMALAAAVSPVIARSAGPIRGLSA